MLTSNICPICKSDERVHRSRARNIFEKLLKSTKIFTIYRCHNCGWRGIRIRRIKLKLNLISLFKFFVIIFIVYLTVQYFVKKYLE